MPLARNHGDLEALGIKSIAPLALGAGVEAVAGPVGRNVGAATEGTLNARILSYVRSRGAFAGATVGGASIRQDTGENEKMYGRPLSTREVIQGKVKPTRAGAELLDLLTTYASR